MVFFVDRGGTGIYFQQLSIPMMVLVMKVRWPVQETLWKTFSPVGQGFIIDGLVTAVQMKNSYRVL
jgi:hypothetical protein